MVGLKRPQNSSAISIGLLPSGFARAEVVGPMSVLLRASLDTSFARRLATRGEDRGGDEWLGTENGGNVPIKSRKNNHGKTKEINRKSMNNTRKPSYNSFQPLPESSPKIHLQKTP